jgi:hypothetical protein
VIDLHAPRLDSSWLNQGGRGCEDRVLQPYRRYLLFSRRLNRFAEKGVITGSGTPTTMLSHEDGRGCEKPTSSQDRCSGT